MDTLGTEILCNFCDEAAAVLFCHDCNMHFCIANGCDDQIHTGKRHKKEPLGGATTTSGLDEETPVCEFCELGASEVYCEDCCMYLCAGNGCLASVHKNAVGHEITSLFIDDGVSEYGQYDEEQEGPSDFRSQSRNSDSMSHYGDMDPELSQLSIRSGDRSGGERSGDDKTPVSRMTKPPEPKREPPKPPSGNTSAAASAKTGGSDLPRSLSGASKAASPIKATTRTLAAPAAAKPTTTSATKLVSKVVKRLVAPIKGTGTKEEREKRKEAVLAARKEPLPKLPSNTFGTKFAPDDAKGRRKPSLSFLRQPGLNSTPSSIARPVSAPSPAEVKRGGDIVITSVTTIRTTTTIRADVPTRPKSQTPTTITRARSMSNSSVASQGSVRGDLPPSFGRSVSDKHASPAASLPSSLFSPSSALPSPTASTVRQSSVRRSSIVSNGAPSASPPSRLATSGSNASNSSSASSASSSAVHARRGSNLSQSSPSLSNHSSSASTSSLETDFEYPTGLAPLGLKYVNAPDAGVLIRAVVAGEAGEKAGLQIGDTVKLLNRKAVRNMGEFQSILTECKSGVVYKMAVVRKDKSVDLKLVL